MFICCLKKKKKTDSSYLWNLCKLSSLLCIFSSIIMKILIVLILKPLNPNSNIWIILGLFLANKSWGRPLPPCVCFLHPMWDFSFLSCLRAFLYSAARVLVVALRLFTGACTQALHGGMHSGSSRGHALRLFTGACRLLCSCDVWGSRAQVLSSCGTWA